MKKLFFLLLVAVIMVACTGCDPINPPKPPVVKIYYLTTVIDSIEGSIHRRDRPMEETGPTSVKSGESITFDIYQHNIYRMVDIVTDNGKVVVPVSNFYFAAVVTSQTLILDQYEYTIKNINENHTIKVTFKDRYVPGSVEWFLIQSPWVLRYRYLTHNGKIEGYETKPLVDFYFPDTHWCDNITGDGKTDYVDNHKVEYYEGYWLFDETTSILSVTNTPISKLNCYDRRLIKINKDTLILETLYALDYTKSIYTH